MPVGPSPLALHGARGRLDRLPLRSVFGYNGIAASTAGAPGTSREQRCSTKSRTLRPLSTLAQRPATCSFRPTCNSRSQWPPRFFHGSPKRQAEPTDHYQTLDLTPDATQAEIKKQFYHLSKKHHPDHNPSDPSASARFQQLASAYAVLGTPSKRQQYDRDAGYVSVSATSASSGAAYGGSYSSAQRSGSSSGGSYGARPASGLSKRRGTFRGPPPSFYAAGGWGQHAAKRRAAQASGASTTGASASGGQHSPGSGSAENAQDSGYRPGGFGDGGTTWGAGRAGDEVPHFDRQSHKERQEEMDERMAARRRVRNEELRRESEALQRDWAIRFVLVSIIVVLVALLDFMMTGTTQETRVKERAK